ncbi:MAG TPA: single-stranded-DNA-specific exonuclease RecJ [Gemmatimonadota bacterium]|nr:single-stranded-DNA-specific exonuclease RecJ [Gemmatimonadota bacterium]
MTPARRAGPSSRWIAPPSDTDARAADLMAALPGLPDPLARVLAARGMTDPSVVRTFLRPSFDNLHDPFLLPDMVAAVDRLLAAVDANEKILVHGDYDADGMCATALAVRGLRRLGARVVPFVPHRTNDGYDLRPGGVAHAEAEGAGVILTVDCGVTALEAAAEARRRDIDLVVTDHHRPGPELPEATAVVDPLRADGAYPFRGLAGVGVAFKLVEALFRRRGIPGAELNQHLDLVTVGTIADQMPLVDENRMLVRAGLRALARTRKPGFRALLSRARIDPRRPIGAEDVAFRLAPRLNSVGRMAAGATGVELLLTDDPARAEVLAAHLDELNATRRMTDREVTGSVERALEGRFDSDADRAVVVWGDDWHRGVIGIVASRMVERWHRPAVVISFDGDVGEGSGRSVEGFHLHDALRDCAPLLESFGGHQMAAGLRIRRERVEEFAARLRKLAAARLDTGYEPAALPIDLELSLGEVTAELSATLDHLAPHGPENPSPVLAVRGVQLEHPRAVGTGAAHLQATLREGEASLRAIGFGLGGRSDDLGPGDRFDVAFHLELDSWRGRDRLQARVLDLRPAGP